MTKQERIEVLEMDEPTVDQKEELDKYNKYLRNVRKNKTVDEDEYLFLTSEMNNIINNNKQSFTDIELLELTQKLDNIELHKDYTVELLELTKEIKKIIKPGKKYEIPKIEKKENIKKEKVKPLSTTAVLPKINNFKKVQDKKETIVEKPVVEPTKNVVNTKNKKSNQLTLQEIVDKNSESSSSPIRRFDTVEIKKLKTAAKHEEKVKPKKQVSKKERLFWSFIFAISVVIFLALCIRFVIWHIENKMNMKQITNIYDLVDINEVVSMGAITDIGDVVVPSEPESPIEPPVENTRPDDYWYYMSMSMLNANFDELKQINPDTVGWIQVAGTNINYPYVQGNDNNFYLKHSFNKSPNGSGWVFLDYRNNSSEYGKNNILYAHARLDNTMFGSLRSVVTPAWYNNSNNYVIKTSTPTSNALWQVFSVYTTLPESYYIRTKFSDDDFDTFINTITARSVHDFKVNMSPDDKILTLSSCYDNEHRVVLHAKLIRLEEK